MTNLIIKLGVFDSIALLSYGSIILCWGFYHKNKKGAQHSLESYFLDGRRLSLPIFIATLVSTWYGGILGVGEFGYRYGINQLLLLGVPYYIFALIFAWILVPYIRASNTLSLVDHCYKKLGSSPAKLVSLAVFLLTSPAPYLWMLVAILQLFIPLSSWALLLCVIIFSACYLISSRFFTIWSSNTLDFVLMFTGFLILVPFCFQNYGGIDFLTSSLPPSYFQPYSNMNIRTIAMWWLMGAWTLVDPGFHQRVRAAKSPQVARLGILLAICAWMLFDFLTLSSALYARALFPDLLNPAHAYPLLAMKLLPDGLFGLFLISLIATVLSTFNSFSFMAAQTLGHDFIARSITMPKELLHSLCIIITLIFSSLLVIFVPSAVDMWYLLASLFLPALLFALLASFDLVPSILIKNSSKIIMLLFISSIIYQAYI